MQPRPKLDRMEGHTFVGNWLTPQSVVLDCGMNLGGFARRIMARYGCRVIGIEANPTLARQNAAAGLECHNYAVCDCNGSVNFRVDHAYPMNSTIVAADVVGADVINVESIRLEDFLRAQGIGAVDLLKLDIEGAEIGVINDTPAAVFAGMGQICAEYHAFLDPTQKAAAMGCVARVEAAGFAGFDFSMNLGNVLFVNRTRRAPDLVDRVNFAWTKYYSGARRMITRTHE